MTVITVKDQSPTEQLLSSLQTWQRDAKKFKQTALYDLLAETVAHIKKQEKALNDEGKKVFEEFTRSEADAAFSDYIRARAVHLVSGDIIETGRLTLAAAEMVGRGINSPLLEKLE